MRRALTLLLIVVLLPMTWLREPRPREDMSQALRFVPVKLPPQPELAAHLGPFRLEAAWEMVSPHSSFGGYSALLILPGRRFLAIGDRGRVLWFSPPGTPQVPTFNSALLPNPAAYIMGTDSESATRDPVTGKIWVAYENSNGITRHARGLVLDKYDWPRAMRGWAGNSGPEAMVRLADGRFLVLAEGFAGWLESRRHNAVLFSGDPVAPPFRTTRWLFEGAERFSPTDAAQLPDGRVLVLMRRVAWPMPVRFAGRIVLLDPADIGPGTTVHAPVVAKLSSSLPVDNFEGIAIESRGDGKVTVWLISDDNGAVFQRSLLWKLVLDPADLPRAREKARR